MTSVCKSIFLELCMIRHLCCVHKAACVGICIVLICLSCCHPPRLASQFALPIPDFSVPLYQTGEVQLLLILFLAPVLVKKHLECPAFVSLHRGMLHFFFFDLDFKHLSKIPIIIGLTCFFLHLTLISVFFHIPDDTHCACMFS